MQKDKDLGLVHPTNLPSTPAKLRAPSVLPHYVWVTAQREEGHRMGHGSRDPSLDSGLLGLTGPWTKEATVQRALLQTDGFDVHPDSLLPWGG